MTFDDNQIAALAADTATTTEPPAAVAAASEAVWLYKAGGSRKGPATEAVMVQLILSRKVTGGTAVWKKGFKDWLKLERTELKVYLDDKAPPPLRGEHINSTGIWVLAFAPLIGLVLEYLVAGIIYRNGRLAELAVESNKYWFITVALNIGLCYYDEHRLKLAGHDTSKFKGLAFIVPVYLYQRAMALHHNLAYFIVWIACFLFIMVA